MLCVKHVHQDSSYFLACETHQKAGGICWRAKLAGSEADRSDQSGRPVRPVYPVLVRVGAVLLLKSLCKPTWKRGTTSRPMNIKAKADWGIPNRIKSKYRITFCLSNPRLFQPYITFFLRFYGVWRCLEWPADLRATLAAQAPTGSLPSSRF